MRNALPDDGKRLLRLALWLIGIITVFRVVVLFITPLQLYPDEAQYWWWAQTPDWGYFSKPPLIAWIVWLTTRFSDAEWAIRIASPLLHAAAALMIFAIGRLVYDARVGLWSALAYITLPGISYSSGLMSTDVPLLFCWALALYAFLRGVDDKGWRWVLLCGVALGVGLLAKYAMVYFALCGLLTILFAPRTRRFVVSPRGAVILLIALLILSPNLMWNAAHGFPTFSHTEANANWSHAKYDFGPAAAFAMGQAGVFGPLMMAGWLGALLKLRHCGEDEQKSLILAAFSAPIFLLILIQAFISEANANWAAPAYVAATPLAVATLTRWWSSRLLFVSLAIATVAMVALWAAQVSPALADHAGFGNALKRQEGWRETGAAIASECRKQPYDAVAAANRSVLAELLYYARSGTAPIRAWDRSTVARDHFQMTIPLRSGTRRALVVAAPEEISAMLRTFESNRLIRQLTIPLGERHQRALALYSANFYRGPQIAR